MKTPYPRFAGIACRFLLTMLLFAPFAVNAATTTAITYQGKLVQHGEPVDGMVDLVFRLYDSETGGNQIGAAPLRTSSSSGQQVVSASGPLLFAICTSRREAAKPRCPAFKSNEIHQMLGHSALQNPVTSLLSITTS